MNLGGKAFPINSAAGDLGRGGLVVRLTLGDEGDERWRFEAATG